MVSPIHTALSGLQAATRRVSVSADNIANQFSRNYVPQRVDQVSLGNGAVQTVVKPQEPATVKIFDPSDPDANPDGSIDFPNVDLAAELVNLTVASYDYKANLKSIKVADNLQKSLIDILS